MSLNKEKAVQEYLEYLYGDVKDDPMYVPDVYQTKKDFLAGWEAEKPKWYNTKDKLPEDDRTVLVKVKDYRRPEENVTEVSLGYYDEYKTWRYQHNDNLIDSGHGWFIEEWIEIPQ